MPFLDSIIDNRTVFGCGLVLTSVESVIFMVVYHVYSREHELASTERIAITIVAVCCLVGKTAFALAVIMPLKVEAISLDGGSGDVKQGVVNGGGEDEPKLTTAPTAKVGDSGES